MPALCRQALRLFKTPGTVLLGVLLWASAFPALARCQPGHDLQALRWHSVVDGDTLRLADGRRLRLVGINTPELGHGGRPDQPLALEARRALMELLGDRQPLFVHLGPDKKDRHGRLLAAVFTGADGVHVGEALLRKGLAWQVVVPPNTGYIDCLAEAERAAREQKRGVWSISAYEPRAVTRLKPGEGGFMRVVGTVTRVSESRRAWWVELEGALSLRLAKSALPAFGSQRPQDWRGGMLTVRGWVSYRGANSKGYPEHVMALQHPGMIERFISRQSRP